MTDEVPPPPADRTSSEQRNDAVRLRRVEDVAGLAILGLLVIGCFVVLKPFIAALLWAIILTIATWTPFRWLERRFGGRSTLAAALMVLLLTTALIVPLYLVGSGLAESVSAVVDRIGNLSEKGLPGPPSWLRDIPVFGPSTWSRWNQMVKNPGVIATTLREYAAPVSQWFLGLGAAIGAGLLELTLSVFVAFFLYRDGDDAATRLSGLLDRLSGHRASHLLSVAENTLRSVVYGIIGTALAQGSLAALGFWIAGVPGPLLLGVVVVIVSILPVGAPVVWVPAAIWLFSEDQNVWGVFMMIYGFFVVSGVDNFLRPFFISRGSALPIVLVFLGVLGGVLAFGFLGVFLGPTLLAVGYTMIREWAPPLPEPAPEPAPEPVVAQGSER